MTNDMTRGNPVRLILAFMIPTFLGNIFQQFYNLVDSVVAAVILVWKHLRPSEVPHL